MENLLINIVNTSLFGILVLINIILCFAFGNYVLRKIFRFETNYQFLENKNISITVIIGFIIICSLLSIINLFFKINYLIFIILIIIFIFNLKENYKKFLVKERYKTYLIYLIIILFLSKISMISYFALNSFDFLTIIGWTTPLSLIELLSSSRLSLLNILLGWNFPLTISLIEILFLIEEFFVSPIKEERPLPNPFFCFTVLRLRSPWFFLDAKIPRLN